MDKNGIVEWDSRYTVGIQLLDDQHKELLRLINTCYLGCLSEDEAVKIHFRLNAHGLINYIKYHFSTEEQLLERIKYPDNAAHKRQHNEFVQEIVERLENIERDQVFSAKAFIRYIRDWMVTHITLIDKKYATYIHFINGQPAAVSEFHDGAAALRMGRPLFAVSGKRLHETAREVPSEIFLG
jgi:hemerythrin